MKKIYTVGTRQNFTYVTIRFFKKNIKTEEHWVIRNVKYIYANNEEEAVEKYERWFFKKYKEVTRGWSDWFWESDGVSIYMNESHINIKSTEIVIIGKDEDIDVNLETLREHMQAENFKEWWFDGQKDI